MIEYFNEDCMVAWRGIQISTLIWRLLTRRMEKPEDRRRMVRLLHGLSGGMSDG
jgi:hypothetical protein